MDMTHRWACGHPDYSAHRLLVINVTGRLCESTCGALQRWANNSAGVSFYQPVMRGRRASNAAVFRQLGQEPRRGEILEFFSSLKNLYIQREVDPIVLQVVLCDRVFDLFERMAPIKLTVDPGRGVPA